MPPGPARLASPAPACGSRSTAPPGGAAGRTSLRAWEGRPWKGYRLARARSEACGRKAAARRTSRAIASGSCSAHLTGRSGLRTACRASPLDVRLQLDRCDSERGRGLFIVSQLTSEFHITKRPTAAPRSVVPARLSARGGPSKTPACRSHQVSRRRTAARCSQPAAARARTARRPPPRGKASLRRRGRGSVARWPTRQSCPPPRGHGSLDRRATRPIKRLDGGVGNTAYSRLTGAAQPQPADASSKAAANRSETPFLNFMKLRM